MKWIHERCAKIRRVTLDLAKHFVCAQCTKAKKTCQESVGKPCDEVEMVNGFCYLGDRLNASGGCEMAVTARTRLGWVKFRECGELLRGKQFSLKIKGRVYRTCVRSDILYGSRVE